MINLLALTGSLYMLQVYDRVLPSRSVATLVGLTVILVVLYAVNGLLDVIRLRVMTRVGLRIHRELDERVFAAAQVLPLRVQSGVSGLQPVRDLDQIRSFLSGVGPTALFDMPWMPVYLTIIFFLHPVLGAFGTAGAVLVLLLTVLTDRKSKGPIRDAAASDANRQALGEAIQRNAEVVQAMGLAKQMRDRWKASNDQYVSKQISSSDSANGGVAGIKVLRMLLQSGTLGLGAFLAITDEMTAGSIIAASIILSRGLAPIETASSHWRGFIGTRLSVRRLEKFLEASDAAGETPMSLPRPVRDLQVQGLTIAPPGAREPAIQSINLKVDAGSALGIIGPTASGKTTLVRAIVGVWRPQARGGTVSLDGAALDQWPEGELGGYIGYLPQDIELFSGTVAENISRFDPAASSEATVAAARAAGVHDMIVGLADGYQTKIGAAGAALSAGQRQRIALARALYGEPFLVVLDEPNSNLDAEGEAALSSAIGAVRKRGGIVIVVAHRPAVLSAVDQILVMANGRVQACGPKDEVLAKTTQSVKARPNVRPSSATALRCAEASQ